VDVGLVPFEDVAVSRRHLHGVNRMGEWEEGKAGSGLRTGQAQA
jgi:hypothetical protein